MKLFWWLENRLVKLLLDAVEEVLRTTENIVELGMQILPKIPVVS